MKKNDERLRTERLFANGFCAPSLRASVAPCETSPSVPPCEQKALNAISADVVDAAVEIHRSLGPGLLESVYELVLVAELKRRGHDVQSQVPISFEYNGQRIENAFRIDVLVDDAVVVELKSTEAVLPVHAKQLKTYLVLTHKTLGLLLNFGMEYMKSGIRRVVHGAAPDLHASTLRVSVPPCEQNGCAGISHGDTKTRRESVYEKV